MKEYLGLKETGWDCINENCGKEVSISLPKPEQYQFSVHRGYPTQEQVTPITYDELSNTLGKDFQEVAKELEKRLEEAFATYIANYAPVEIVGYCGDLERFSDESSDDYEFRVNAHLDGGDDEA
jgi:hypothetical protein